MNNIEKISYPSDIDYQNVPNQYDTQKWLTTIKTIYYGEKNGLDRKSSIHQATSGWNVVEIGDFLNWLRFYEGGNHLKYKFAQLWYTNDSPGYFLHIKKDEPTKEDPSVSGKDVDSARDAIADELSSSEKKRIIEKQRNKIIGRLDSAEKLLRTNEGQLFAGKDFESLLEILYSLKKKIQMINKISTSIRLYEDMIVREANIFNKKGFSKAAEMLYSIANGEEAAAPELIPNNLKENKSEDLEVSEIPKPTPPPPPQKVTGDPGGLPSTGPGAPLPTQGAPLSIENANSPTSPKPPSPIKDSKDVLTPDLTKSKGITGFVKNVNTGNITDITNVDDNLEVFEVDDNLLVEAQVINPNEELPLPNKIPPPHVKTLEPIKQIKEPLEVKEEDLKLQEEKQNKDFDHMIDSIFSNITISDIINKLEYSSNFFRKREIPRQLSIIDLMLNSVGLSALFPTLSEATNKALESNNYILTRIDDILSRLRGTIKSEKINVDEKSDISPEMEELKEKLEKQDEREKEKKQTRKDIEDNIMQKGLKENPEIELGEEFKPPVKPTKSVAPKPIATPLPPI